MLQIVLVFSALYVAILNKNIAELLVKIKIDSIAFMLHE
jgi:hypothetical protein